MAIGLANEIVRKFEGVDNVIIAANLGGATGVAPVFAAIQKEVEVKVIAILQLHFPFEYRKRLAPTRESLEIIKDLADKINGD